MVKVPYFKVTLMEEIPTTTVVAQSDKKSNQSSLAMVVLLTVVIFGMVLFYRPFSRTSDTTVNPNIPAPQTAPTPGPELTETGS